MAIGLTLFFLTFLAGFVSAQEKLELIYFWGDGCPHCAKESKFLEQIAEKYPDLEITKYEVWYDSKNQELFKKTAKELGITQLGVPLTIVGDKYFVGYGDDETTGKQIEDYIQSVLEGPSFAKVFDPEVSDRRASEGEEKIKIPFLGEINLSSLSLPALAVVLGAIDGFNPCAMWILLFLIALLINVRSRKKLLLIGGTFIFTSGVVYFLILSAWLNLFLAISYVSLTRTLIGLFALGFGVWQIKEFITYNPGVCKVLGLNPKGFKEKLEEGLKSKAEKLVSSPLTWALLGGIIILAIGVNLIELFCSAGIPAVFTRILALNQLSGVSHYFYLLLYTFVFMLDDIIVFSLAIITLRKIGFTEKYNYWATLIGGLLILILGILLIFKPSLLMFG